ncbi:MAG: hypothetical protein U0572_05970 [Phycisphaerales bacterium]
MVGIVTMIVVGVAFLVALVRPAWTIAIVMMMFPIEQALQASNPIFTTYGTLTNYAIGCLTLWSLVRLFFVGGLVWQHWFNGMMVATTVLFGYAAFSYFWTASPEWLLEFMKWTGPYIMVSVVCTPLLVSGIDTIREVRLAILLLGSAIAMLIMANPNFELYAGRLVVMVDSTRSNPLATGELGGMIILAAVLGSANETKTWQLALRISALFIGLGMGFLSGSRGETLGSIGLAVLYLPLSRKLANLNQFLITVSIAVLFAGGILIGQMLFVTDENEGRWSYEAVMYGGSGRLDNVLDLAGHYFRRPQFWLTGLGSAAFHDLPTTWGDPYSHVLSADLVFELGVPGIVIAIILGTGAVRSVRTLFRCVHDDPVRRASVAFLAALTTYSFLLANKKGVLWAQYDLFFGICLLARLAGLQVDAMAREQALAGDAAATDEFADDSGLPESGTEHAAALARTS